MPVGFPSLRTVLQSSAAALISFFTRLGESAAEIAAAVSSHFPTLTPAETTEAYNLSESSRRAGSIFQRIRRDASVRDANVPVDPSIPHQYRYQATAEIRVEDDPIPQYRTVIVDSSSRLTRGQLEAIGANEAATFFEAGASPKSPLEPVVFTVERVTVDTAFRRA
jgi:hypothetical protein